MLAKQLPLHINHYLQISVSRGPTSEINAAYDTCHTILKAMYLVCVTNSLAPKLLSIFGENSAQPGVRESLVDLFVGADLVKLNRSSDPEN